MSKKSIIINGFLILIIIFAAVTFSIHHGKVVQKFENNYHYFKSEVLYTGQHFSSNIPEEFIKLDLLEFNLREIDQIERNSIMLKRKETFYNTFWKRISLSGGEVTTIRNKLISMICSLHDKGPSAFEYSCMKAADQFNNAVDLKDIMQTLSAYKWELEHIEYAENIINFYRNTGKCSGKKINSVKIMPDYQTKIQENIKIGILKLESIILSGQEALHDKAAARSKKLYLEDARDVLEKLAAMGGNEKDINRVFKKLEV